jgi:hypothetical protein
MKREFFKPTRKGLVPKKDWENEKRHKETIKERKKEKQRAKKSESNIGSSFCLLKRKK